MQRIKRFFGVTVGSLLAALPGSALALAPVGGNIGGIIPGNDLIGAIRRVLTYLLLLAGLIAVIYLIYGGVQYITSAGDQAKADGAKKTILYALVGLIVIGFAMVLVNFVITAIIT